MSLQIYQDQQTPSAQFRQWLGDGWGCIVRDLETIIVLVLLAFNFIPQRSHYAFTLTRSRFRDSATVTRTPGDGTTKVYITTGIPTRVVGTCFCGENLGNAGNLSICVNFKVFSFVMKCNNKKDGAIFGCHMTFCAITEYL